ncbi:MarR family winged helix-turn-helix transcriptional regulator [Neptuniibacter caesariensis]|uniref:Transcriptional regulatory protein, MarR family protein n=1 Tax=Neptuniibacter caesariensis TaxID=207954 RepID=A0A7U8GRB3_NEPCE|nr:winged helix DNA-binding protein [Neptuniibacter caesariensis]EAR60058.1 Transcriptional regulatory protein, MarR family protein [Neptuniibacter caesariensis]
MSSSQDSHPENRTDFLECLRLIERLHRRILDIIKFRLEALGYADINSVQALLLHNIGDREMTAGELRTRGYYLGSNVSYNLKKMVSNGYIKQERSEHDLRSVRISLSQKGMAIHNLVSELFDQHLEEIGAKQLLQNEEFSQLRSQLRELESFWDQQISFY